MATLSIDSLNITTVFSREVWICMSTSNVGMISVGSNFDWMYVEGPSQLGQILIGRMLNTSNLQLTVLVH